MKSTRYITNIEKLDFLTKEEKLILKEVTDKYAFRVNEYYLKLIDRSNPSDPLRKLVIPSTDEL